MGGKWQNKRSQTDRVYGLLRDDILAARVLPGERLPSRRRIATDLGAGEFPVQRALERLAAERYVIRRHGSGTYVLDRSAQFDPQHGAVLCMHATGHMFGELTALLCGRLHDLGMLASVLDTSHGDAAEFLDRALRSPARFVLLSGSHWSPTEILSRYNLENKCVIIVLDCHEDTRLDHVHRIAVDYAAGSRLLADHMWMAGHRRLLLIGNSDMLWCATQWNGQGACPAEWNRPGTGLEGLWTRRGGQATRLTCQFEGPKGPVFDEGALSGILAGRDAPTVLAGLRDVDTWCVREALRQTWPEALRRLTFIGDGDTPWSLTSHPPFTTLNCNLALIADLAYGIIRDVQAGKTFKKPVAHLIPPRLVAR